jgi:predicted metalloendopeptidase
LDSKYIVNVLIMRTKQFEIEFEGVEMMNEPKKEFDMFLFTPLFLKEYNTLVYPAVTLLEPIFSLKNPIYLNYATVGVFLSHEIWHSIEVKLLLLYFGLY